MSARGGRWWVALNVQAADLYPASRHPARTEGDHRWLGRYRPGFDGVRGRREADGRETAWVADPPKALAAGMARQRRLARDVTRKRKGSVNRKKAAARLRARPPACPQHLPASPAQGHQGLGQDPDPVGIEDPNVAGVLTTHRPYPCDQRRRPERVRPHPGVQADLAEQSDHQRGPLASSSKTCSVCCTVTTTKTLAERTFTCET